MSHNTALSQRNAISPGTVLQIKYWEAFREGRSQKDRFLGVQNTLFLSSNGLCPLGLDQGDDMEQAQCQTFQVILVVPNYYWFFGVSLNICWPAVCFLIFKGGPSWPFLLDSPYIAPLISIPLGLSNLYPYKSAWGGVSHDKKHLSKFWYLK